MNSKNLGTLEVVFEDPVRADIEWRNVVSLLNALDAEITEGRGSRVRVSLNGVKAVFHEPHPEKEMQKGAIRPLRDFLRAAGISIDEEREKKG
jgi:HicA toxin of bacterial toxin-antitoxin,